ncbi:hypothetical protein DL770_001700 [Monosporascus sp. CRB-9-2]|nr:hypothetical protein DL770_001700 [Monosporascus sp. CRB-9-2]
MRIYTFLPGLAAVVAATPSPLAHELQTRQDFPSEPATITFFGYPDNCDTTGCYCSPEGCQVAYNCQNPDGSFRNFVPGGDGSWGNPLSMAFTAGGSYEECGIVYLPYLQKYGILDDSCSVCEQDHLDVWVESACSDEADNVCECENTLTPDGQQTVYHGITSDPGSVFPVNTAPLYDQASQTCSGQTFTQVRRDSAGEFQSVPDIPTLIPRALLRRQSCFAVGGCVCPSC